MRFCCRKFSKFFLTFDKNSDVFFGGGILGPPPPPLLAFRTDDEKKASLGSNSLMSDLGLTFFCLLLSHLLPKSSNFACEISLT